MGRKAKTSNKKNKQKYRVFVVVPIFILGFLVVMFLAGESQKKYLSKYKVCANTKSCKESFESKVENGASGYFANRVIPAPIIDTKIDTQNANVQGVDDQLEEKRIYVDLAKQTLTAYDGEDVFMTAFVSSGKWYPTPIGEFRIWTKIKSTRMSGGEGADYYNLPNVPFTMYFEGDTLSRSRGFAIHGAYWHNNFGHPMSHGCINMRHTDVEKLFNWANPETSGHTTNTSVDNLGTRVTIFGEAPL